MKNKKLFHEKDLKIFLKSELAAYKIPKQFFFMEALPHNAAGKIVVDEVKKKVLAEKRFA